MSSSATNLRNYEQHRNPHSYHESIRTLSVVFDLLALLLVLTPLQLSVVFDLLALLLVLTPLQTTVIALTSSSDCCCVHDRLSLGVSGK